MIGIHLDYFSIWYKLFRKCCNIKG